MLVERTSELKVNDHEYAYLKTIAFTANDLPKNSTLAVSSAATRINMRACQELFEYILTQSASLDLERHHSRSRHLADEDDDDARGGSSSSPSPPIAPHRLLNGNGISARSPHNEPSSSTPSIHQSEKQSKLLTVLSNTSQLSFTMALQRYSTLLQVLPTLRWFDQSVLVELFFSGLIGNLSIETVMPFILNMDVMSIFDPGKRDGESASECVDSDDKQNLAGDVLSKRKVANEQSVQN